MGVSKFKNVNINILSKLLNVNKSLLAKILSKNIVNNIIEKNGFWAGGGIQGNWYVCVNNINGFNLNNDTSISISGTLAIARSLMAGVHSINKGYWCGGGYPGYLTSEIDGIDYTTKASINPSINLTTEEQSISGVDSDEKAFVMFGYGFWRSCDKIYFINSDIFSVSRVSDSLDFSEGVVQGLPYINGNIGFVLGREDSGVRYDRLTSVNYVTDSISQVYNQTGYCFDDSSASSNQNSGFGLIYQGSRTQPYSTVYDITKINFLNYSCSVVAMSVSSVWTFNGGATNGSAGYWNLNSSPNVYKISYDTFSVYNPNFSIAGSIAVSAIEQGGY